MRSPFDRIPEPEIIAALAEGWGLEVTGLRYVPEGAGAYHWMASVAGGGARFVTVDDLDTKPWLGDDRTTVFAGLVAAYAAAIDLRGRGLSFVVAPQAGAAGPVQRLDARHAVSVFGVVEGTPGRWGSTAPVPLDEIVGALAALHGADAVPAGLSRQRLVVPRRDELDRALRDSSDPWRDGPFSEAARLAVAEHRPEIEEWLRAFDATAARLAGGALVVTHGEPHPGNLIATADGVVLVDWDTVALARPERDLWMFATDPARLQTYEDLTGTTLDLDGDALVAYRHLWALADLAAYTAQLRSPHGDDPDAERALAAIRSILAGDEPAPYRQ